MSRLQKLYAMSEQVRRLARIGAMTSTLTIRSAEENPRKADWFISSNCIFTDDLFVFDATFMDELIRTPKSTNTKKTRKKDEENTKETRNFSSTEGENHRAKTAR